MLPLVNIILKEKYSNINNLVRKLMQNTTTKLQSTVFVNSTCNATIKSNFLNLGIVVSKKKTKMYILIFVIAFAKA